jgi:hypothetical protein
MTRVMFAPLVLLAASASPATPATQPATDGIANFRPTSSATAHATVSIRIVSGVRFGSEEVTGAEGAVRRKAVLAEADGSVRSAELLEFQ